MWPSSAETTTTASGAPRMRSTSARSMAKASAASIKVASAAPILNAIAETIACVPENCHAAASAGPSAKPAMTPITAHSARRTRKLGAAKLPRATRRIAPASAASKRMPIQRDPVGAAGQQVAARRPVGRQEVELELEARAELWSHVHANRKLRLLRGERVLELGVEEPLVPEKVGVGRQARPVEVRARSVVAGKGAVGEQRNARLPHYRRERDAVRGELDLPAAGRRGVFQPRLDAREVEVARAALGQAEAREQIERYAQKEQEAAGLLFHVSLQQHLGREVSAIGERGARQEQ